MILSLFVSSYFHKGKGIGSCGHLEPSSVTIPSDPASATWMVLSSGLKGLSVTCHGIGSFWVGLSTRCRNLLPSACSLDDFDFSFVCGHG